MVYSLHAKNNCTTFMSQRNLLLIGGIAGVFVAAFVAWGIVSEVPPAASPDDFGDPNASIVYFYGKECSHCKDLEKFLSENSIYEKVPFAKKEVWYNKKNARDMESRAKECGLEKEKLGVPFLFSEGKCFVGGPDVEKFFREKAGI